MKSWYPVSSRWAFTLINLLVVIDSPERLASAA